VVQWFCSLNSQEKINMKDILPFRPYSHLLLILLVGGLAYANTFQVPFTLDDLTSIVRNPWIGNPGNFLPGDPSYEFMPRRWVVYLSFALNHHFGGLEVAGYHLVNLLIHLGTASLLYALVILTFQTPQLATSRLARQDGTIALLAALLFVAHPVQTQAVTYIVQRLSSMATLFYLAALVLYVVARLNAEKQEERGVTWRTRLLLIASVAAAVLAMKSKEIAFTLPLAVALYEWCFFRGAWPRRLLFLFPLLATLLIIPLSILTGTMESGTEIGEQLRAHSDIGRLDYLTTQFRVLVTYLRLLILPINQNLDYEYPLFTSFLNPQVLASVLLLSVLLALAVYLHYRSRLANDKEQAPIAVGEPILRLISFGIFWFFLTLSVESSIIPIHDLIFEHRLYLPSIGIAMAMAVLVGLASAKTASFFAGRLPLLLAALVVVSLAVGTWQRNQVWSSNVKIWQDTAQKSPNKVRAWYNFGTYLDDEGKPEEAIQALTRAITLDPQHAEAWHNLGRAYIHSGRSEEAVPLLRNAVRLNPEMLNAIINLAVALIQAGKPEEAIFIFERNLHRFADWPEVRLNLCIAYALTGDLAAAHRELAVLERLAPHLTPPLRAGLERAATAPLVR
jgi:tetratricopeptide (TPR) repeat protein